MVGVTLPKSPKAVSACTEWITHSDNSEHQVHKIQDQEIGYPDTQIFTSIIPIHPLQASEHQIGQEVEFLAAKWLKRFRPVGERYAIKITSSYNIDIDMSSQHKISINMHQYSFAMTRTPVQTRRQSWCLGSHKLETNIINDNLEPLLTMSTWARPTASTFTTKISTLAGRTTATTLASPQATKKQRTSPEPPRVLHQTQLHPRNNYNQFTATCFSPTLVSNQCRKWRQQQQLPQFNLLLPCCCHARTPPTSWTICAWKATYSGLMICTQGAHAKPERPSWPFGPCLSSRDNSQHF